MNNTFHSEQIAKAGDLNADLIMRQYKVDKLAKFIEIKSISSKLNESEIAKDLAKSTSTLQRYRREVNMLSINRRPLSSNTNTRKQKTSNHSEHDLKMTPNDLKMTSNDLKETSKESVKSNTKNKLKGGDPNNDKTTQGSILIEQAFSSN